MRKFDEKIDDWNIDMLRHPSQFGYMLRIGRRVDDEKVEMASLKVEEFDSPQGHMLGQNELAETTAFTQEQAQQLMDALWHLGLRPTGCSDSEMILEARDFAYKIAEKLGVGL